MECAATDGARAAIPALFTELFHTAAPAINETVLVAKRQNDSGKVRPDVFVLSGHHHGANRQHLTSLEDCSRFEPQPP